MSAFDTELLRRLEALREKGLYRQLRHIDSPQSPSVVLGGKPLLNFSSNDYLGLANDPLLKESAIRAVERFGSGSGASRLICGSLTPHLELEELLAQFKGTESALSFTTGYATAIGTIGALLGPDDVLVLDKRVHASIVDAARLSHAKLRVFPHNDLDALEQILGWADARDRGAATPTKARSRTFIVTESVFSMDGDHAPLREIVQLKETHGAWLMVDEAHATGLYGEKRRGLAEELGVAQQIEIQMGTLGKALGASGGYICGSRTLIDFLINRARSFIFSTAPVPAAAAAATAGIRFVQSPAGEQRCARLWQRVTELKARFPRLQTTDSSAIIPLMVGHEEEAVRAGETLLNQGILIPAVRFPTVSRGQARLRLTLSAAHTGRDVAVLGAALPLALPSLQLGS